MTTPDALSETVLIEASRLQREQWEQERIDLDAIDAVWYTTDANHTGDTNDPRPRCQADRKAA